MGIGNNADTDDDNDGVADGSDDFPLDSTVSFVDKILLTTLIFSLIFIPTLFIGGVFAEQWQEMEERYDLEKESLESLTCILNCDDYEDSLNRIWVFAKLFQLCTYISYGLGSIFALMFGPIAILFPWGEEDFENEEE